MQTVTKCISWGVRLPELKEIRFSGQIKHIFRVKEKTFWTAQNTSKTIKKQSDMGCLTFQPQISIFGQHLASIPAATHSYMHTKKLVVMDKSELLESHDVFSNTLATCHYQLLNGEIFQPFK